MPFLSGTLSLMLPRRVETPSTYLPLPPIRRRRFRLVIQDPLNLLHNLRRQLRHQRQRLAVILNLLDLRRAKYHRANILILRRPCECQLRRISAHLLGNLRQLADFLDLGFPGVRLQLFDGVVEEALVVGEAGAFGDAVVVLAG